MKIVSFMDLSDTSQNDPTSEIVRGIAYRPDGSIDYEYVYTAKDGSHYSHIPPEEAIPLTKRQKAETVRILQEDEASGAIDLSRFEDPTDPADCVGGRRWVERLDRYFGDRGTTKEEFWRRRGFDYENELEGLYGDE
jgi:hypothetical protein